LKASVVVDRAPMKVRVLVRGAPKGKIDDAVGEYAGPVSSAIERLRVHGAVELVEGTLVTTLDRQRVDAWTDASGIESYASDVAVVAHAIVIRTKRVALAAPTSAPPALEAHRPAR